jgi:phosphoglycolate phosphatase-like HAD superfamily hydrolase
MDHQSSLRNLKPEHDFFIGIDSDGCVFDSMEVKQKEFFIPNALKYFNLFAISGILRKTWEFVNLYSIFRGGNRFTSVIKVFDLLKNDERVISSGIRLPDMNPLKEWVKNENKLGNENLRKYLERNYDPDLESVLIWSEEVNHEINRWLRNVPPFPNAIDAIRKISSSADLVIVSQTPLDALEREWKENDLKKYVRVIAGQEHGTKTEHIALSAKGKYESGKILMAGDAKGDLDAAKNNGILFFPIIPGNEDRSWEKFLNEGFERFIKGTFAGTYENSLIEEFKKTLPETPT